jgi:hypothetical protein
MVLAAAMCGATGPCVATQVRPTPADIDYLGPGPEPPMTGCRSASPRGAGEQGHGFSVVAAEARDPAGPGVEAAGEFRKLTAAPTEAVDAGAPLVASAGKHMADIAAELTRVSAIVRGAAEASATQPAGAGSAGYAMTQVDEAMKQNAVLVRLVAAATRKLERHVAVLVDSAAKSASAVPSSRLGLRRRKRCRTRAQPDEAQRRIGRSSARAHEGLSGELLRPPDADRPTTPGRGPCHTAGRNCGRLADRGTP